MGVPTGGRSLGTASAKLTIDTRDLEDLQRITQRVGRIVRANLEQVDEGARKAQQGLAQLGDRGALQQINALGVAIGALSGLFAVQLAQGVGRAAIRLAELDTEVRRTSLAFEILAGSADAAEARVRAVVRATGEAVTRQQAQQIATQAVSLGLATTSQELAQLTRAARAAALVSPVINDIGTAISELGLASANLSFRRLDQLGLSVSEVRERIQELRIANSDLDDSQLFLLATVELLNEKYGELLDNEELQASGLARLRVAFQEARVEVAQNTSAIDRFANRLADSLNRIRTVNEAINLMRQEHQNLSPEQAEVVRQLRELQSQSSGFNRLSAEQVELLDQLIDRYFQLAEAQGTAAAATAELTNAQRLQLFQRFQAGELDPNDPRLPPAVRQRLGAPDPMFAEPPGAEDRPTIGDINAERREEERKAQEEITKLQRDHGRERQRITEQFESQRTRTIAAYERQIAREAEDFARSRARQNADLERQIGEIREQGAAREVEARRQLEERVADITRDFQERRARLERDHRDSVAQAAARLDARAVAEEQRRFARQRSDLESDFDRRLRDERESFRERNDLARAADEERIADLRENLQRQQEIEDQDRAIRLRRLQEDHQRQLQEQAQAHQQRLAEMVAYHNEALAEQRRFIRTATADWRQALRDAEQASRTIGPQTREQAGVDRFPSLRDPNFTIPRTSTTTSSVRTASVVVAEGAIQVNGVSNPIAAGDIVEDRLIRILREFAGE